MSYGPVTWEQAESVLEPTDHSSGDKFYCPLCDDRNYGQLYLNESNTGEDDIFVHSFCMCDNFEIKDWIRDRVHPYIGPGLLPPKRAEKRKVRIITDDEFGEE